MERTKNTHPFNVRYAVPVPVYVCVCVTEYISEYEHKQNMLWVQQPHGAIAYSVDSQPFTNSAEHSVECCALHA